MLIYNTTFHVEEQVRDNFLIWLKESYIPEVERKGLLKNPRLCRLLSHKEENECYAMQWEVESSTVLHRWHTDQGAMLNNEITRIFQQKVMGFPTLMEVIE